MMVSVSPGAAAQEVKIKLNREWAPVGVAHLHELMAASFYDESRIFRSIGGACGALQG